jgi:hypothetical protein
VRRTWRSPPEHAGGGSFTPWLSGPSPSSILRASATWAGSSPDRLGVCQESEDLLAASCVGGLRRRGGGLLDGGEGGDVQPGVSLQNAASHRSPGRSGQVRPPLSTAVRVSSAPPVLRAGTQWRRSGPRGRTRRQPRVRCPNRFRQSRRPCLQAFPTRDSAARESEDEWSSAVPDRGVAVA